MDRKILSNCALFESLSYNEISMLLGCIGARYRRMLSGTSMYTDRIIVVLSGEMLVENKYWRAGAVLVPAQKARHVAVTALTEAFFIDYNRLLGFCGNSCPPHRTALINLMKISLNSC